MYKHILYSAFHNSLPFFSVHVHSKRVKHNAMYVRPSWVKRAYTYTRRHIKLPVTDIQHKTKLRCSLPKGAFKNHF